MSKKFQWKVAALSAVLLGLSACGTSPTAQGGASPDDELAALAERTTAAIADINTQLEGLDAEARRTKLIELAMAEGGEVSFYGSTNPEDVDPLLEAFEEQTGLSVNNYRASGASVLQRIQEEARAGFVGADVSVNGPPEYLSLIDSSLLAKYESPIAADIAEGGVSEYGLDVYRTLRVPLWNTDRLTPDQYPTSWEDIFENYPGETIVDPTDWDWFAAFTQQYLMGEKGMTEEQALDWWRSVAPNLVVVSGHTLGTQLVTTGEHAIAAVTYQHGHPPEGAPVMWRDPLWPVITSSVKVCIMANTTKPASALLLAEFFASDGQPILFEGGRTPMNVTAPSAWPPEYNDLTTEVPPELLTDDALGEKWQGYYEEILSGAGQG